MKIKKLFESKHVGILYHFTSIENLLQILLDNQLNAFMCRMNKIGISFTRNKNLNNKNRFSLGGSGHGTHLGCAIVVDGNKLSERFKFVPYNFAPSQEKSEYDESEEILLTNNHLENIRNYIIKIIIFKEYAFEDDVYNLNSERKQQYIESKLKKIIATIKFYNIPMEIK